MNERRETNTVKKQINKEKSRFFGGVVKKKRKQLYKIVENKKVEKSPPFCPKSYHELNLLMLWQDQM